MSSYLAGSLITVSVTFTDVTTGNPADPTTVSLKVGIMGSAPTTYTGVGLVITKVSTGIYQANLDTTFWQPGQWTYQWKGTGAVQAIGASTILVTAPPLGV